MLRRQAGSQTDGQPARRTDRQKDRQTERQTDRQTENHILTPSVAMLPFVCCRNSIFFLIFQVYLGEAALMLFIVCGLCELRVIVLVNHILTPSVALTVYASPEKFENSVFTLKTH